MLSFISDEVEVLPVKIEVSGYMLIQTAEAQSSVLPDFKCRFICERAVKVASMQFLTKGRLKQWVLDEDFKKVCSFWVECKMFFLIDLMIQFGFWIYYGYEECLGHCLEST